MRSSVAGPRWPPWLLSLVLALLWQAAAPPVAGADECSPQPEEPGPPERVLARGVDAAARLLLLHLHNAARNRVAAGKESRGAPGPQPTASDMHALKWDEDLAKMAQKWADRHLFQHNPCRTLKKYSHIGENLAIQFSFGPTPASFGWKKAVDDWYNEVEDWSKDLVPRYKFNPSTGHYTQLAWGRTTRVGCGYTAFVRGNFTHRLFVCDYGPGGNVVGQPLYTAGRPRAACRRRRKDRRYPALCPQP